MCGLRRRGALDELDQFIRLAHPVAQVDVLRDDVVVVGVQMRVVHVHHVPVDQNLAQTDQFTGEVVAVLDLMWEA